MRGMATPKQKPIQSVGSCKHVHKCAAISILSRCKVNPLPSPAQLGSAGKYTPSNLTALSHYVLKTIHVCVERPQ